MILLKQILVATDFSEPSEAALAYGRELARTFGAQLTVLHVQGGERRCGAGTDEVARVTVERSGENDVEAGHERDKCEADREEYGDKQAPPEPELAHENR